MIDYNKLWKLLDEKNIPKTKLLTDGIVIGQSYTNLVKGQSMTMKTLDKICRYLNCQPGDILEYLEDNE